jgi:hypothetical protein
MSSEMDSLLNAEILPTYDLLDSFKGRGQKVDKVLHKGVSLRNLIGQAQLRLITSSTLKALIEENNRAAMQEGKHQYVLLMSGKNNPPGYKAHAIKLRSNPRLTKVQALNLEMNLQLIEMEEAHKEEDE